jgi:hypothetical protein
VLGVVALAIGGSYSKISNNCLFLQLTIGKHFFQVVIDGGCFHIVELRHHLLADPDIFIGIHRVDTALPAGCNKGQVFCGGGTNEGCSLFLLRHQAFPPSSNMSVVRLSLGFLPDLTAFAAGAGKDGLVSRRFAICRL